jgi:hypothetical protein
MTILHRSPSSRRRPPTFGGAVAAPPRLASKFADTNTDINRNLPDAVRGAARPGSCTDVNTPMSAISEAVCRPGSYVDANG